jgi:hypothetical protein
METFGCEVRNMKHVYILWLQNLLTEANILAKACESSGGRAKCIFDAIEASQLAIFALREAHDSIS